MEGENLVEAGPPGGTAGAVCDVGPGHLVNGAGDGLGDGGDHISEAAVFSRRDAADIRRAGRIPRR